MGQDDVFGTTVETAPYPIGEIFVRQVSETRQNSLLEIPRVIVAGLEHVTAVIRLDDDSCTTAQPFGDQGRDVAKIHHRRDLDALVSRSKPEIVDGIVRNCERVKIDLANLEVFAGFDLFHSIAKGFNAPARFIGVDVESLANVSVECLRGNVNRTIDGVEQDAQAARMIAVFVSYEHSVETLRIFADECESTGNLFRA